MEKVIKSISDGHRLTVVEKEKAEMPMLAILLKAYADTGQKVPSDHDMVRNCQAVYEDVKNHFPLLTLDEIDYAIGKMIRGYYGEFTGVTVANIHKALKAYAGSAERQEFIRMARNPNQKQLPDKAPLSQHEIKEKMMAYTEKAFSEYKETGYFMDLGNAIYDFLDQQKIIQLTPKKKREIFEGAKKIILAQKKKQRDFTDNAISKIDMARIIKAIETGKEASEVIAESKRIALNNFFAGLTEMDMDIKEYIEEKLNN